MANDSSNKTIYAAMGANLAIAITKFIAASITGSSAMISEGIHSVVDTGDQLVLLLGIQRSQKPANDRHPFGYGLELYFWTFIVAILIFALGGGMSIYEGITHLIHPSPLEDPTWNYIVLSLAILFEGYSWTVALKEFLPTKGKQNFWQAIKNSKDPTVITILFEDTAAILGLFVALIGIFLGHLFNNVYFDGIASIIIGIILAIVAVVLARESKGLLVGESADPQTIANIRSLSKTEPGVKEVIRVLTMQLAPKEVLLNLEIQFSHNLTGEEIALTVESLEAKISQKHPEIKQIFIEAKSLTASRKYSQNSQ
ncbi:MULTISPECIES: cation diffusion facilitator family transporter [unclassified Nostoc]|uniref:cation diffusion facilitator family transporter n=1 Tax=unclassified Nostoc TaxID=2593658 RepID=UPI002AD4F766|nr:MULTISPECIES: cation diffusion facilitator family transporter [unclassified Nostoc]MDZ8123701.1 cation diffusion facilitator family transporter [Nostoc sp. CmiVER01]MDZ8225695.1 cation diffusion facilitator family transporter [Nostoc sp. ChiVER01]